jgi:hypothetical protein
MAKKNETKIDIVEVNRKEFVQNLMFAKNFIDDKKIIPIFSNIVIGSNKIIAFNGKQGIFIDFNIPMNFLLNKIDEVIKLTSSYSGENVEIKLLKEDKIKIDNTIFNIINTKEVEPFDFYSTIPVMKEEEIISIDKNFIEGLKMCILILDKNSIIENKKSITVIIKNGIVTINSANDLSINSYKLEISNKDLEDKFLLPYTFCKGIIDITKDLELNSLGLTIDKNDLYLKINNNIIVYTNISRDGMLDFYNIIKENIPKKLNIIPLDLFKIISRINNISNKGDTIIVSCDVDDLYLSLNKEYLKFEEEVRIEDEIIFKDKYFDSVGLCKIFNSSFAKEMGILSNKQDDIVLYVKKGNFETMIISK